MTLDDPLRRVVHRKLACMKRTLLTTIAAGLTVIPVAALAHGDLETGTTELTIGWAVEPAFAGFPNAVEVTAIHDGQPRNDAKLRVVVLFGGEDAETTTEPLPLRKSFGQAGNYQAPIIPTEPGQYTFHITGTVGEDKIDEKLTSGESTFDDVDAGTDLQFPNAIPATSELTGRIDSVSVEAADALAAAENAKKATSGNRLLTIFTLGVAALSAVFAFNALRKASE
jgi:hypothetical protein